MCLSETIQRMRSCNAASETGMPCLEKSTKKPAPHSLRSLGQLCLQSSSRHRQVPARSGYWKKQSVQSGWSLLKLPPHGGHQASGVFRRKAGLFPLETPKSQLCLCVSPETQGQAGSSPTIFRTQMLVSRRLPGLAW